MTIARIYQPVALAKLNALRLDEPASHHVGRVLRAAKGDHIVLFDGHGGEYRAEITSIDKKGVEVKLLDFSPREVESALRIYLAQGMARGEKMDFIVQKAVELGVHHITPLLTERSNVRLDKERQEKRWQHWQSVAVSACEQSGRNRVPMVAAPLHFNDWVATAKADCCFVLSPHVQANLEKHALPPEASILLLIGPEGGLSEFEIASAERVGFLPLNLGPRVLRTETAAIAALAALQTRYGDFCS